MVEAAVEAEEVVAATVVAAVMRRPSQETMPRSEYRIFLVVIFIIFFGLAVSPTITLSASASFTTALSLRTLFLEHLSAAFHAAFFTSSLPATKVHHLCRSHLSCFA